MRTPTEYEDLYRWHEGALKAKPSDRYQCDPECPECGWYVIDLTAIKKPPPLPSFGERSPPPGKAVRPPLFPAAIGVAQWTCPVSGELLGDEFMWCEIMGERKGLTQSLWLHLASFPISKEEHAMLMHELLDDVYVGPKRPRVRWTDPQEIAADMERYALKGMTV